MYVGGLYDTGVPSPATGTFHAGHHFQDNTKVVWTDEYIFYSIFGLLENLKYATNGESPVIGGDSACPPEPPLRFAMMSHYLFSGVIAPGGCHSGGGGGITCRRPKRALRKIV